MPLACENSAESEAAIIRKKTVIFKLQNIFIWKIRYYIKTRENIGIALTNYYVGAFAGESLIISINVQMGKTCDKRYLHKITCSNVVTVSLTSVITDKDNARFHLI